MLSVPDNPYRTAAPGDLPGDFESDSDLQARIEQLEQENAQLKDALDEAKSERADLLFTLRRMRQIGKAMESECSDVLRECGENAPKLPTEQEITT